MIKGNATREEQIDATMRVAHVGRSQAEQIYAIESGESDGDVELTDANGKPVPLDPPKDAAR